MAVKQASSLAIGGLTRGDPNWHRNYSVWEANNTWFREAQWQQRSLGDVGIDDIGLLQLNQGHRATMARYGVSNRGSFSAEGHLPMGGISREDGSDSWLWQIEHNGSWRWEIGDWQDGLYLAAGGPNSFDHDWEVVLAANEAFTSVPVAVCHVAGGLTDAFGVLNDYRRCLLRPHVDREELPVIFNDYMNCLMGDPTEAKVAALIEPAARSGAKYFVIDAGWYADDQDWWEDVGAWRPSSKRFPSGFASLMHRIKARGLVPGVWLEPEVIGIRSPVAKLLPEHAFFQLNGHRLEERGRYQLDFAQDAVREHMDGVVDGLVGEYGIGYFKFDYNIDVVSGSDAAGSPGAAHLAHQRAYLAWVAGLCQRHPALVVENCSSGGMRMDYAMLAVHTLQSTSDQQDPLLYAAIAAACPTAVVPEQSASWAYPQPQWSDETNAFTVVNALLGRVHLSGRLDLLSAQQSALVDEGLRVYRKHIRAHLCTSRPFWPLGLPRWHDEWLALGLSMADGSAVVAVWRRGGSTNTRFQLPPPLRHLRVATLLYPANFEARLHVDGDGGSVRVEVPDVPCARVLKFSSS